MKAYIIHEDKETEVTDKIGSLTWSDSEDSLGISFSFQMPFSANDPNHKKRFYAGDVLILKDDDNETLLKGIITRPPINGSSYSGYDFAWYLNKSETVTKFNGIRADKAITQLLNRYGIPRADIPKMTTTIKKLYKDVLVSDVIKDILKQVKADTGKKYKVEMRNGDLTIYELGSTHLTPKYKDDFGKWHLCTENAEISGEKNIEELKNRVIVAGTDDKKKQVKATAESKESQSKYGLLTAVETFDNLDSAKAKNKAKNLLEDYNQVAVSFTAKMPGNFKVRSGRRLQFVRKDIGLNGWYKVVSCTHTITNGVHTMTCEMEG